MKNSDLPYLWFWVGGVIFIWIDALLGHLGGGNLHNIFMWLPLLGLPLAAVSGVSVGLRGVGKVNRLFLQGSSWLLIITGFLGCYFHGAEIFSKFAGSIQWEVIARMIRYPPILAPLGVSGLGVFGLLLHRRFS